MSVVAVTGSSGYLGTSTLAALGLDPSIRLRTLHRRPSADISGDDVVIGDLRDRASCEQFVAGADTVIHLAGLIRSQDEVALREINVDGTERLATAALEAGVQRFVHVSSTGVYGRVGHEVSEASPREPEGAYERSKAEAEIVVSRIWKDRDLVIVQPSNIVGSAHSGRVLERFLKTVANGRPIIHGGAWTNYVAVDQVALTIAAVARATTPPAVLIVNVPMPLQSFADLTGVAVGRPARSIEVPSVAARVMRPMIRFVSRMSGADRLAALADQTRFATIHADWFTAQEIRLEIESALATLVVEYAIGASR